MAGPRVVGFPVSAIPCGGRIGLLACRDALSDSCSTLFPASGVVRQKAGPGNLGRTPEVPSPRRGRMWSPKVRRQRNVLKARTRRPGAAGGGIFAFLGPREGRSLLSESLAEGSLGTHAGSLRVGAGESRAVSRGSGGWRPLRAGPGTWPPRDARTARRMPYHRAGPGLLACGNQRRRPA